MPPPLPTAVGFSHLPVSLQLPPALAGVSGCAPSAPLTSCHEDLTPSSKNGLSAATRGVTGVQAGRSSSGTAAPPLPRRNANGGRTRTPPRNKPAAMPCGAGAPAPGAREVEGSSKAFFPFSPHWPLYKAREGRGGTAAPAGGSSAALAHLRPRCRQLPRQQQNRPLPPAQPRPC